MRIVELTGPKIELLRRTEVPDPLPPTTGRIHVRMAAASMNYIDLAVASGRYGDLQYPLVPLADGAGEVVAVGPDVWQVAVGDRVAVHPKPFWIAGAGDAAVANRTRGVRERGSLVELADLDAATVVKAPPHLGWAAIAAIPVAAMTAWKGLEAAAVGPASTIVLLGTGGLSIAALQLAKARGARVVITSSSNEKLDRARDVGADETINYRERPDWPVDVRRLTGGIGADMVIDVAGGEELARAVAAVRYGGLVYAVGFVAETTARLDLLPLISNGVRVVGTNGGSVADLAGAMAVIEAHRIEPVVDRTMPLAALADAYRLMQRGGHFGKIAVTIDW